MARHPSSLPAGARHHRLLAYPRRVLTVGAVAASAAALALPAAASAQAASPAQQAATPRLATTAAASRSRPSLVLPGLHAASYTVTLITGDQVKLTAEGDGKYAVNPAPATRPGGSAAAIQFTDTGGRDGSVYAVPSAATALLTAGRVSMQLFDVSYLASHGDAGPGGHLPVTLQYGGHKGPVALARVAARLPGATVTSTAHPRRVNLRVRSGQAGTFWAALTSGTSASGRGKVNLADRIREVTVGGTMASATVRHPAGAPVYTLTEDVTARDSAADCAPSRTICEEFEPYLTDISTDGSGPPITPVSQTCVNSDPCSVMQLQWNVPAGVYMATNTFATYSASRTYMTFAQEPQITVAADTTVTIDLNDAQPVTVRTPHPSETYSDGVFAIYRGYPGLPPQQSYSGFTAGAYGYDDYWAVPTQPVTTGTFKAALQLFLGRPYLTMSVKAPEPITLNPIYSDDISSPGGVVRFSGHRTLPLAYAGLGSKKDYTGLNAHGRLVLIRLVPWACAVTVSQLRNALNAGAAGVLLDPVNSSASVGSCQIPLNAVSKSGVPKTVPKIPFAALPLDQATTLIGLLSEGPVRVTVTDDGATPYLYQVYLQQENTIPSSLTYDLTARQLTLVNARYHQSRSTTDQDLWEAVGPDEGVAAVIGYPFTGPASIQEYYGPVSPDTVDITQTISDNQSGFEPTAADLFTRPSVSTQDWGELPAGAVGTIGISPKVNQAVPGAFPTICAACRQGDMFYPEMYQTYPEAGLGNVTGYIPSTVTLYQNGQLVPQGSAAGYPAYQLPAQPADYRLTLDQGKAGTTTWDYSSAQPGRGHAPDGTECIGTELGSTDPCQAVPLIFLRYNAGLDLGNAWTAPGSYPLRITAYHQEPSAPTITGLTLWTSTNGGATWKKAAVASQGDGTYNTTITVPKVPAAGGTVSIKVRAEDADGDDVTQVLYNAWNLVSASG
ncbi:MAG TPA: hypothetical protein VGM53_28210 [Streptosporangiaceae bacterium]